MAEEFVPPSASKETPDDVVGLGTEPKSQWPRVVQKPAIDRLGEDEKLHDKVLRYLTSRIDASENEMVRFYPRWRATEKQVQAYIDLPDYERILQQMNDEGKPPKIVDIVVPFTYATITTIVTFLLHTFTGRKPMFQVGTYKGETVESARNLETMLQFNADHTGLIRHIWNFLQDALTYGLGVMRTDWREEFRLKTVEVESQQLDFFGMPFQSSERLTERKKVKVYEGNIVVSQDPFMFFPDPRVPMADVATRGEFVFWRTYEGRHALLKDQANGILKHVKKIPRGSRSDRAHGSSPAPEGGFGGDSSRSLRSGGWSVPGINSTGGTDSQDYLQIDEGTIEIIPKELGLGDGEEPEKWLFTIGNMQQIIQARRYESDHDEHPVVVTEPNSVGYGFGHVGMGDYLRPLQDAVTWLFNSHMGNVKRMLNDVLVVDPSMIEMQDIKKISEGGLVRLKQAAFGRDVRTIISQLQIQDVTRSHVEDMGTLFRLGTLLSGVDENLMGAQDSGGRKTATEVRTSTESGASRLAAMTRIISAQAMTHLTRQMSINLQQFLSDDFYIKVTGADGARAPIMKADIQGDFSYPIHDGTLPLDRVAMVDVWREVLQTVIADPELRGNYSVPKIFEFIAELGGARNLEAMRINVQPDQNIANGLQAGNLITPQQSRTIPGAPPAQRAAGGF